MREYIEFTKKMKSEYTVLLPNMLDIHFRLIGEVLNNAGFRTELLEDCGREVVDTGLKYVHNDTCYPALLVTGQLIAALNSGRYDTHKVAFLYFQTGGGCRASNYIALIRKALAKAGYEYVPVISFSISGLEKHSGFKVSVSLLIKLFYAIVYGDLMMSLVNQCAPYEIEKGQSRELARRLALEIADEMVEKKLALTFSTVKRNCRRIIDDFAAIPMRRTERVKVGVVGEIYIKFSPLGNNNLVDFLNAEGAEAVVPGLLDFFLYSLYGVVEDYKLYRMKLFLNFPCRVAYKFLTRRQQIINNMMTEGGATFTAPLPFDHTVSLIRGKIGIGVRMGEGWLLPAEMLELYDSGVKNIVCAQPFGCLPNHICGKGMMKPLRDKYPDMNIVAIDYDPGATRVNQENRIKLMLANARENIGLADELPESVVPQPEIASV